MTSKEKKALEDIKVLPDYRQFKSLEDLRGLVTKRNRDKAKETELKADLLKIETRRKEVDAEIGALLSVEELKSVRVMKSRVTVVDGVSAKLSKTKLVELGVGADVIKKATTTTQYSFVKVTEIKE